MTKNETFELLELFKTKANHLSHLYDVYHGEPDWVHMWIIYENETDQAMNVASFRFEDLWGDDEILVEIKVKDHFYQFIDYIACKDLINKISY